MIFRSLTILFLLTIFFSPARGQMRDGRLFDPGVAMTEPAEGAPPELSKMLYVLGQWDVDYREFRADTLFRSGRGLASITLMNRGHAIMERMYCKLCADSLDVNTLSFLGYDHRSNVWNLGEANGFTESMSVHSGDFEEDDLVLRNAIRRGGGPVVTTYRKTYRKNDSDFSVDTDVSTDYGETWKPWIQKRYSHRAPEDSFLMGASKYGVPDPTQPEEARAFDFLIGTYDAPMQFHFLDGRNPAFESTTTAVFAMNGQAILEYGWYDVDKRLPDAATSIIRLYNRAMRRWESIYMANRSNGTLFFGGRQEGDEIILSEFESDLDNGPIQRWVFHDIGTDGYHWYGAQSFDRGKTYSKYWIIDMTRKESDVLSP
jgi:hypothetical protein